jgi:hypothetical protein
MSPVPRSSRLQVAVGKVGANESSCSARQRGCRGAEDSRPPRRRRGWLPLASSGPRSGRAAIVPATGAPGAFAHDAAVRGVGAPHRSQLDHEPALTGTHLDCGMVEVDGLAVPVPRGDPLEDATVAAHRVGCRLRPAAASRDPRGRTKGRTPRLAWSNTSQDQPTPMRSPPVGTKVTPRRTKDPGERVCLRRRASARLPPERGRRHPARRKRSATFLGPASNGGESDG